MKQEPMYDSIDVYLGGNRMGYHTIRIPAIVVSDNRTVITYAEARRNSAADNGDIDLVTRRSEDGGKTWDDMKIIHAEEGPITIGNPVPIVDRDTGAIHLTFTRDNMRAFYAVSRDDGRTYTAPVEITESFAAYKERFPFIRVATGPVHGIQMSSGRLVVPFWMNDRPFAESHIADFRSGIIYSDDHGETWKPGGLVPPEGSRFSECTVLERSDGSLYLNMRATMEGYRFVSHSNDGGITWSSPVVDTNLPDPTCQGSVLRLSDADGETRALFCNLAKGGPHTRETRPSRDHLTVRVSHDEGKTWPVAKLITEAPSGYSDLAIDSDGTIYLIYENGTESYRDKLTVARFNLAWLTGG